MISDQKNIYVVERKKNTHYKRPKKMMVTLIQSDKSQLEMFYCFKRSLICSSGAATDFSAWILN